MRPHSLVNRSDIVPDVPLQKIYRRRTDSFFEQYTGKLTTDSFYGCYHSRAEINQHQMPLISV